jgi:hypothetical protein
VRFGELLAPGEAGVVYAEARLDLPGPRRVRLELECDDACRVFLNSKPVAEQTRRVEWDSTRVWRGADEYEQVHYGMGTAGLRCDLDLPAGASRLLTQGLPLPSRAPARGAPTAQRSFTVSARTVSGRR